MVEISGTPEIPVEPEKVVPTEPIADNPDDFEEIIEPEFKVSEDGKTVEVKMNRKRGPYKKKPKLIEAPIKPKRQILRMPTGPVKLDYENLNVRGLPKRYIETADGRKIYQPVRRQVKATRGGLRQKGLTSRRRRLIKVLASDPDINLTDAAMEAGMHVNAASRALRDPDVLHRIEWMMESHPKLRRNSLLSKLAEGLEAKKTIVVGRSKDSEVIEPPDFAVRHQYLETAFKLNGDLRKPDDNDGGQGNRVQLAIIINQERIRRGLDPVGPEPVVPLDVNPDSGGPA